VTLPVRYAPSAPWRRIPLRRQRVPGRSCNAWSAGRAALRLVRLASVLLAGVAQHALVPMSPGGAPMRDMRRRQALQALAARVLRTLHVQVRVAGPQPIGPVLYASNHLSWLDILVLLVALPECVLVAKQDVAHWPLIGRLVRATNTVLVERKPTRGLLRAVAQVTTALSQGLPVLVFAEGTTSDGTRVLPFKSPFFEAALRAGVPVVPVALRASTGSGGPDVARHVCWWGEATLVAHLPRVAGTRQIQFVVQVGEPLSTVSSGTPALTHRAAQEPVRNSMRRADPPLVANQACSRSRSLERRHLARCAHDAVQRLVRLDLSVLRTSAMG